MPNNYFVQQRKNDKDKLLAMIKQDLDLLDNETKLIASFCHITGYRRQTVKDMLEELKEAGVVY